MSGRPSARRAARPLDMVLGDGARDRGASAELISSDPAVRAGVAFVRLESDPDPVRVRAAWVVDADIRAMADQCTPAVAPLAIGQGAAA
jgi:DNA segregation ATPase FtsK/SpoIIIE, S-DNA-T family